ncbi:Scr1 family TA system antitoxin-like transcriptional regulator [Streptomyces sp. I5]|uniref:Scr1 family TA system antitoxin-like transcriptional regulator n=1 Tax=Streptomyces sp. I5 TaxID=2759947 RepID=UPI0035A92B11
MRRTLSIPLRGRPSLRRAHGGSVLRYETVDPAAMCGQLRHLLAVMQLVSVSLGIIPFTAQRTVWPLEAFYVHDGTMAVVETLTAETR